MKKRSKSIAICLVFALSACSNKDNPMPTQAEWSAVRAKLAFTCVHEVDHLPPLDPQADTLFKYALFLEKKPGPKDYDAAARYYRIAAAYGHYKANHNLQLLVSTGQASSPHATTETIDLAEQLIAAGIPGGYYDMGHYKGETIPPLVLNDPRIIPGLDWLLGMRTHKTNMAWTLKAHVHQA
jgi:hypothetical protein